MTPTHIHLVTSYLPSSFEARAPWPCVTRVYVRARNVETRTDQQAELRLCDQIWNGRESHSSSCSLALRGSHSDRGQSQGHRHRGLALLPLPSASSTEWYQVICAVKRITLDWVLCLCVCVPRPVWSEDEDEGAVSASGPRPEEGVGSAGTRLWLCSALSVQEETQSLPARTGRCLYEFTLYHAALAGLSASVRRSINVDWYLWASYLGIQTALVWICCITGWY